MRLMKGKVKIKPVLEKASELIDVEQRRVTKAVIVDMGECEEVEVGWTVYIKPTGLKMFMASEDSTLIMNESDILARV
jgi:co-chaperonin GroES (HSP10)